MAATATDLIKSGRQLHVVSIEGVTEPIEICPMTVEQALKFGAIAKREKDYTLLYSQLIKLCCPAFRRFWWTPRRIKKSLALNVMLRIAEKIMEVSGYTQTAVSDAVKK